MTPAYLPRNFAPPTVHRPCLLPPAVPVPPGERKRVTTAEMLVGPRRVLLLDEISTGLDSATLYAIADLLCKVGARTSVV